MKRKIIEIDQEKCTGCGLCVNACHEGALQMVDGKAKLVSDTYCDGLGACLPACPADAIRIIEREADAFSEEAVLKKKEVEMKEEMKEEKLPCGCPGTMARSLPTPAVPAPASGSCDCGCSPGNVSRLTNWPVQLKLVPVNAPYLKTASLLIAADCAAYALPSFHETFMKGKVTLIGCPKLDDVDYTEKLTEILKVNDIRKITVVRMEVPCCAGIVHAVRQALINSGKMIPWQAVIVSTQGEIIED